MKKVFYLFAVAITACSLFVACGDDEEEPELTNGIAINFDGNKWTAKEIFGIDLSASFYQVYLDIYKDYENETTAPSCDGFIPAKIAHIVYNDNDYCFCYYENDNDYTVIDDKEYANWQPYTFDEDITAIDLTALTLSGVCRGTMYHLPEAMVPGATIENLPKKDLTITVKNATWNDGSISTKNKGSKKHNGKVAK